MNKFGIGQAVRRVEDQRFLTGRGRYVDDINLPRQCYGVAVLSPHAHARIRRVDVARAAGAPGVRLRAHRRRRHGREARRLHLGADARGRGRAEGPPHRSSRCWWPTGCASSATASRMSWPRRRRRRATPPSWSRSTTSRCRPWCTSTTRRRTGRRRSGTTVRPATSPSASCSATRTPLMPPSPRRSTWCSSASRTTGWRRTRWSRARRSATTTRPTTPSPSTRPRRIRTAAAWRCRTSFTCPRAGSASCPRTSAAASA